MPKEEIERDEIEALRQHDDWLSRREDSAYRRGMLVQRLAGKTHDDAFAEVMRLLGCDGSTQFAKVPGMVKRLLDKLKKLTD